MSGRSGAIPFLSSLWLSVALVHVTYNLEVHQRRRHPLTQLSKKNIGYSRCIVLYYTVHIHLSSFDRFIIAVTSNKCNSYLAELSIAAAVHLLSFATTAFVFLSTVESTSFIN